MFCSGYGVRSPGVLIGVLLLLLPSATLKAAPDEAAPPVDPTLVQALEWRLIGPFRGGRVTAVAGVRGAPLTFFFGATGGGVWRTEDAGTSWKNISDGFFKTGTVGAIAVAESDPNVIYVGMGEAQVRGVTTSFGDGVYKSTDRGRTWTHLGLERTRQISAVRIHPQNPNMVYVAAQGNPFLPNPERGVYRSVDGGLTWRLLFFVDERSGVSDLAMDPSNPRILYAAFWEHQRRPWNIESGGPGSGLYKSTDGGESWTKLEEGLPELMGKIGVTVSPARPDRLWAIIEADEGGLFRSDDAGKSWERINEERVLRARAWYYTKVFADPRDANTVYVLNAPMMRSVDGGKTFHRVETPHGDNHALWIDPDEPRRMINGNDGGAAVSHNGGETWSSQNNQPTGQFYRVRTDARFPYFVYGGQQDNSTVAIASRSPGPGIGREDWYPVGGCESAHIAFDPQDPRRIYAGCYQGLIDEYDISSRRSRNIMVYPFLGLGSDPKDQKYRFNWNAPIVVSPHDKNVIFHAGNVVLRSTDRGQNWEVISEDLTRDEEEKQGKGGGPITNEAAGAETYNTIFSFVESPHEAGTFYAGTDDGFLHLSRDGGATWVDVTPEELGEAQINAIEISPHDPAGAWIAVNRYKLGDFGPYIYTTADYGTSWEKRVSGIADEAFVRVVREDPARPGLLYAGTEAGLYLSLDDGRRWQHLALNLPSVPITDLAIRDHDLVAATQGRAFWILDDLAPLHQWSAEIAAKNVHLMKPRDAVRASWGDEARPGRGHNPPNGATIYYYLAESLVATFENSDAFATLEILDSQGWTIRRYESREPPTAELDPPLSELGFKAPRKLPAKAGLNRFVWDLSREQVAFVPGLLVPTPRTKAYRVAPGVYRIRLSAGDDIVEKSLTVLADPRTSATPEDFDEQQRLISAIWERVDRIHVDVERMRRVRDQIQRRIESTAGYAGAEEIRTAGLDLAAKMTRWEEKLVQPKQKTFQDVINFPNRFNAQLLFLLEAIDSSDPPVTSGARHRWEDLDKAYQELAIEMRDLLAEDLASFNALFEAYRIPAVTVPATPPAGRPSPEEDQL